MPAGLRNGMVAAAFDRATTGGATASAGPVALIVGGPLLTILPGGEGPRAAVAAGALFFALGALLLRPVDPRRRDEEHEASASTSTSSPVTAPATASARRQVCARIGRIWSAGARGQRPVWSPWERTGHARPLGGHCARRAARNGGLGAGIAHRLGKSACVGAESTHWVGTC